MDQLKRLALAQLDECQIASVRHVMSKDASEELRLIEWIAQHPVPYDALMECARHPTENAALNRPDTNEYERSKIATAAVKSDKILTRMCRIVKKQINGEIFIRDETINFYLSSDRYSPIERVKGLYSQALYLLEIGTFDTTE